MTAAALSKFIPWPDYIRFSRVKQTGSGFDHPLLISWSLIHNQGW
ncbi:MAG: hypothetical protein OP8BY_2344 [Candidatus Saccharicenans subterraneus]|uniref:Uncharacterized protein n=1 Tax=Candidatus Saccharicenans subterraneus TaxID=2508984 RepID=A0A3E2BMV4_9BACT|nr:MAG: hypothetical protein OP8BY_2344 [Candidatus Saccharicenans subterraneum]